MINDNRTQLIIEAGVKYQIVQKSMDFNFSNVAGLLISHEHGDHSHYLKQFDKWTSIPIYATQGTLEALNVDGYRYHTIQHMTPIKIGSWTVIPFNVEHDAAEPVGFVIENYEHERLLYVTDTYYVKYKFKHIKYMMVEMNYSLDIARSNVKSGTLNNSLRDRILTSHFEMENSLNFINANKSKELVQILLLHLSDANSNEQLFKRETQAITGVPVHVAEKLIAN